MNPLLEQLASLERRAQAADDLICKLASGEKDWRMCIPPQADDTDMALVGIVRDDVPSLLAAMRELVEGLERYESVPLLDRPGQVHSPMRLVAKEHLIRAAAHMGGVKNG